ncbi:MAG: polysaccharide deacetylase, partial [Bacteroidetes bacterium]|nr:polysaccharide deacetylase [Bacteroidota bacterium]
MKKLIIFISWLAIFNSLHAADNEVYVAKYKNDRACAISYTFDDGLKEHYTLVAPGLENLGFKGTFWVNGLSVETDNDADKSNVSWGELKEMSQKGHEISNHGWSHKNLTKITLEEAAVEIEKNDSIISANLGFVPRTFCYPY